MVPCATPWTASPPNFCHPNALTALLGHGCWTSSRPTSRCQRGCTTSRGSTSRPPRNIKAAKNMASIFAGFGYTYHRNHPGVCPPSSPSCSTSASIRRPPCRWPGATGSGSITASRSPHRTGLRRAADRGGPGARRRHGEGARPHLRPAHGHGGRCAGQHDAADGRKPHPELPGGGGAGRAHGGPGALPRRHRGAGGLVRGGRSGQGGPGGAALPAPLAAGGAPVRASPSTTPPWATCSTWRCSAGRAPRRPPSP